MAEAVVAAAGVKGLVALVASAEADSVVADSAAEASAEEAALAADVLNKADINSLIDSKQLSGGGASSCSHHRNPYAEYGYRQKYSTRHLHADEPREEA